MPIILKWKGEDGEHTIMLGKPEAPTREVADAQMSQARKERVASENARASGDYGGAVSAMLRSLDSEGRSGKPHKDIDDSIAVYFGTMGRGKKYVVELLREFGKVFLDSDRQALGFTVGRTWLAYVGRIASSAADSQIREAAMARIGHDAMLEAMNERNGKLALRLVFSKSLHEGRLVNEVIEGLNEVAMHEVAIHSVGGLVHSGHGLGLLSADKNISFELNDIHIDKKESSVAIFRMLLERSLTEGRYPTKEELEQVNAAYLRENQDAKR